MTALSDITNLKLKEEELTEALSAKIISNEDEGVEVDLKEPRVPYRETIKLWPVIPSLGLTVKF